MKNILTPFLALSIVFLSNIALADQRDSKGRDKLDVVSDYVTADMKQKTDLIVSYVEIASQTQPHRQVVKGLLDQAKLSNNIYSYLVESLNSGKLDHVQNIRTVLLQTTQSAIDGMSDAAFKRLTSNQ
jgi:hypothetical protein